MAEKTLMSYG